MAEFRAIWAAEALSQAGDQLARVALSVLVYQRTNSVGLTGLAYGLTFLPTLIGGTLLSQLADRFPRRTVMVVCDLLRAAIALLMAIPGVPFTVLCGLLVVLTIAGGPFRAAQLSMLPAVFEDEERYVAALGVRNITVQFAQVVGFGAGGLAIAFTGPYWGMAIDAVTFLLSAALVRFGVKKRKAAAEPGKPAANRLAVWLGAGPGAIRAAPGATALFGFKMLAGLYVIPEGLAAPYAAELGVGAFVVGLILASDPVGSVIGAWAFTQVPVEWRSRLVGWLAIGAGVPLVFLFLKPGVVGSLLLIAVSGVMSTPYQMQATAMITRAVPDDVRGQVSGLTSTALVAVQGLGIMIAGAFAQFVGTAPTIGIAALVGVGLAVAGLVAWLRATAGRTSPGLTA
ncbi:MFS transporter [Amycolatopsis sp. H20-H5]|uniref:MFS transporter n=1 Tax=Amycolatopsis sp. H20-H5 TaxID=3046309 RepID=UPI002DB94DC9|nr:MFS transporter [Amycolatopsis sp. H20-H5]MEC3977885.1 MFS transporter [Amycolatopsis sp. H20-H5]